MIMGRGGHPEELISASLTGDLSSAERATLDAHLASCARCRETLDAFATERRLLGGLRHEAPPRDLGARVRAGTGAASAPAWWRRPSTWVGALASVATVVAAVLAVVVLSGIPRGPIGSTQSPLATASLVPSLPSATPAASPDMTGPPTEPATVVLQPGELGYLSLTGEPLSPGELHFVNDATGRSIQVETPSGPPISAAISPTGEWLAYITEVGEAGVNQVWVLHLEDGSAQVLGCSLPHPFTERLTWSDDGRFLAYTLAEVHLDGAVYCGGVSGDGTATNAWVFDSAATGLQVRVTDSGDAFAGDFLQSLDAEGGYTLLVSHAADEPYTEYLRLPGPLAPGAEPQRVDGVFLPLVSPNGERALFWRGRMAQDESGAWRFEQGGMPYVSGEPVDSRPSWSGEPLVADLQPVGGAGFESARLDWGADSDQFVVWATAWTGTPQDPDGRYPSADDVYVGRLSDGLLTRASRLDLTIGNDRRIVSVALDPSGVSATVTIGFASAGIGDPPSATLLHVPVDGGEPRQVGSGAANPEPWLGPAVYGTEAIQLPH